MKKKKGQLEELDYKMEKQALDRSAPQSKHIEPREQSIAKVNAFKEIECIIEQVSQCLKIPELGQVLQ